MYKLSNYRINNNQYTVRVAYCESPGDQKSVHNRDTS